MTHLFIINPAAGKFDSTKSLSEEIKKHYGDNVPVRFDVVSILGDKIHWVKNAFSYDDI